MKLMINNDELIMLMSVLVGTWDRVANVTMIN